MVGHAIDEILTLRKCGKFAIKQQVTRFQKVAVLCKLFNREAAIEQGAFVAIDIGDVGLAGGR